jgi:(1->4)-alpha-D-glucan 1-alpha-D-glucosylmutase
VIARALAFRGRAPALFTQGAYQPLRVEGPAADHIFAFLRLHEGRAAIAVGTRLSASLELEQARPLVAPTQWRETRLVLPRALAGRRWVDVFAPEEDTLIGGRATVSGVLRRLPVALLEAR